MRPPAAMLGGSPGGHPDATHGWSSGLLALRLACDLFCPPLTGYPGAVPRTGTSERDWQGDKDRRGDMNFRTGLAVGAGGAVAALSARRLGRRALGGLVQRLERRLERAVRSLTAAAERGGPLVKAALAGVKALHEGKSPFRALLSFGWTALKETLARIFGRGRRGKPTNIVEQTDVGAPRRLVYDQWTRFEDFPSFMKKVVSVDQTEDGKLHWKAKIFWSSRTWESTIVEQVPDE
ncbi:hypothetical protein ETD83_37505, partial [Actinomadura soli]